jgi:hypothetical protein
VVNQTDNLNKSVDPGILEIIGAITEVLGLADYIQKILPLDQIRVERRHRRVQKLLVDFAKNLEDARAAIRVISSVVSQNVSGVEPEALRFKIPDTELPVLSRGIDQLQVAIRAMTKISFSMEGGLKGIPHEEERYYRISAAGLRVLDRLRSTISRHPEQLAELINELEIFLTGCSKQLSDREEWLND